MFEGFGFSIDVFPGVSQSYSAIVVLEFEETASSTSTISLSTSTIKAKTEQLQYRWLQAKRLFVLRFRFHVTPIRSVGSTKIACQTHQAYSANRLIDAWGRIKIDALTAWFCNLHTKWHGKRNCEGRDRIAARSATSCSHNLNPFTSP